jgi:membrane protein
MSPIPQRFEPIVVEARRVSLADPFLISGAIAYNVFFALIPLVFAVVAALSMATSGDDVIAWIEGLIAGGAPADVGTFVAESINEALEAVSGMGTLVLVLSVLVALWSGSRAIYAVQKALRLIEGIEERRAYWKTRGLGILLTFGAGVALVVAYVVLLFGGWVVDVFAEMGISSSSAKTISGAVTATWAVGVLFSIYRWGISESVRRPLVSAIVVTTLLSVTTWLGAIILPSLGGGTIAALGSVGVILIWAYVVGFVVIVTPSAVVAVEGIVRGPGV